MEQQKLNEKHLDITVDAIVSQISKECDISINSAKGILNYVLVGQIDSLVEQSKGMKDALLGNIGHNLKLDKSQVVSFKQKNNGVNPIIE